MSRCSPARSAHNTRSQLLLWGDSYRASIEAPFLVTENGSESRRQNSGTYSRYPNFVYGFLKSFMVPTSGPQKTMPFKMLVDVGFASGVLLLLCATPDDGDAMSPNVVFFVVGAQAFESMRFVVHANSISTQT